MFSKRFWMLLQYSRRIGVRVSLIAALAVLSAIAAWGLEDLIPVTLSDRFGPDAVMPILNILATSMLAVVTFSLSVMVSAYRSAAQQVTPRVHRLLLEDTTSQMVLATFLGAFIFSLVAIILFRAGFYGDRASVIVFSFTAIVVVLVVVAILRWIDHLSEFGSMDNTLKQLERRVTASLAEFRKRPGFGAARLKVDDAPPKGATAIRAYETGYVEHIDLPKLAEASDKAACPIYLTCVPGDWVVKDETIALVVRPTEKLGATIRRAVTQGSMRNYDQDPRFGLFVLAEIASRALSPGVNDSGTALEVISRLERVLTACEPADSPPKEPIYPDIFLPPPAEGDLIDAAFAMIARDGADKVEVMAFLLRALRRLAARRDPGLGDAARAMSHRALAYADAALTDEADRKRVREAAGGG